MDIRMWPHQSNGTYGWPVLGVEIGGYAAVEHELWPSLPPSSVDEQGTRLEDDLDLPEYVFPEYSDGSVTHEDQQVFNEQLLDLEGQFAIASNGLIEEEILGVTTINIYPPPLDILGLDIEPELCAICQENYSEGNEIGTLDCGHYFHFENCIKEWLKQQNSCPICRAAAAF